LTKDGCRDTLMIKDLPAGRAQSENHMFKFSLLTLRRFFRSR